MPNSRTRLSTEIREKLGHSRPATLGQAAGARRHTIDFLLRALDGVLRCGWRIRRRSSKDAVTRSLLSKVFREKGFAKAARDGVFFQMFATQDKSLTCADCGQEFTFTASEQQFFADRGFTEPRRCPSCRALRKAQRGDSGGGYSSGGGADPRSERLFHSRFLEQVELDEAGCIRLFAALR